MTADYRTPLKRIRHFGSSHHGVEHFIAQKVTALALLALVPAFLVGFALAARGGAAGVVAWLGSPVGALLGLAFFTVSTWHMRIGMQVVIEDYVQSRPGRYALLIANTFVSLALWGAASFSLLLLALGS